MKLTALILILGFGLPVVAQEVSSDDLAAKSADDVFIDEGDNDFELSLDASAPPAKSAATKKSVAKKPEAPVKVDEQKPEPPSVPPPAPEKTAAVEMPAPVEEAKSKPAAVATQKKSGPAKTARGVYVTTKEDCTMTREPASASVKMLTVKASRKLWVEEVDASWVKAFNKAGEPGFINRDCLMK